MPKKPNTKAQAKGQHAHHVMRLRETEPFQHYNVAPGSRPYLPPVKDPPVRVKGRKMARRGTRGRREGSAGV